MKSNPSRSLAFCLVGSLLPAAVLAVRAQAPDKRRSDNRARERNGTAFTGLRQQVAEGSEAKAREYYIGRLENGVRVGGIAQQIGFPFRDPMETTTVADLLAYLKYPELTPLDLHVLSSADLMAKGQEGEILATRFFAPKITDVTDEVAPPPTPAGGFGWRKLIRIKARPDSTAAVNKVEFAWFLQNITEGDVAADPFDPKRRVSLFNQVILTRKGTPEDGQSGGWYLTFGRLVEVIGKSNVPALNGDGQFVVEGRLNFGLDATFDEPRDPESNSDPKKYHVPTACAVCHGSPTSPKINYLDTDHWFDRVTPAYGIDPAEGAHFQQEDFTAIATSPHGVIYDGGKDRTTPQFKAAFEVIRKLNIEVEKQNAEAKGTAFQRQAVEKWNKLHKPADDSLPPEERGFGDAHVPPHQRGFGNAPWQEDKPEHRKLIYYFNRYCYRCHSSVSYHVMDRASVRLKYKELNSIGESVMAERLKDLGDDTYWMPQDRMFPGLEKNPADPTGPGIATGQLAEFLKLLDGLGQEP